MKTIAKLLTFSAIFLLSLSLFSQEYLSICNSFETEAFLITIDTAGTWEIGEPSKAVFNSSYSGLNSIVTDLDSLYAENDTSSFIAVYKNFEDFGGIPNYLDTYMPFELSFDHRFITDSLTDFGSVEMSLDNGVVWYNMLSNEYNADAYNLFTQHYFEGNNETLNDSLIVAGNSNGWVHSYVAINIDELLWNSQIDPDSIIVKFTFISDGIGRNEGWQIDNLCLSMEWPDHVFESRVEKELAIYPNPNNGEFYLQNHKSHSILKIYNLQGELVFIDPQAKAKISTNLQPGIYVLELTQEKSVQTTRMIVE